VDIYFISKQGKKQQPKDVKTTSIKDTVKESEAKSPES